MLKGKYVLPFLIIALAVILLPDISAIAEAADLTPSYANKNIGSGVGLEKFDKGFTDFVKSILHIMRPIVTILTAVAGLQIAFGISDGKKTVWNWILGAGLAISFADFVYSSDMFGSLIVGSSDYTSTSLDIHIKNNPEANSDFLSHFMAYYKEGIIYHGAEAIKGVCIKLLLILFTINCSMKLALDLISGDKIKFLISETLKAGFYLFLIMNWVGPSGMDLTGLLSTGFQEIGFKAGGAAGAELEPDSIWKNGVELLTCLLNTILQAPFDLTNLFLMIVTFVVACYCILMTSIEMFMVRVEFLTMALLSMPLLAFAMIEQFNFLAQKAIGAVFNLAMKCCVIAFIQAVTVPYFKVMIDQVVDTGTRGTAKNMLNEGFVNGAAGSFMAFVTLILGLFVILMLTKKIPALVTGLLNGTPSLSGGDMTGMAGSAAGGLATATGAVTNAWSSSGGGGKGSGGSGGPGQKNEGTLASQLQNTAKPVAQAAIKTATMGPVAGAEELAKEGFKQGMENMTNDSAQPGNQNAPQGQVDGTTNSNGNTQNASADAKMPDTGVSKDGKKVENAKKDAPDTSAQGADGKADAPVDQNAVAESSAGNIRQNAPQSTGGGSGSFSDSHPNLARAGRFAGNLAKAMAMASPAGNVIEAYGKGRNLAGGFDKALHGDTKEEESQAQQQAMVAQVSQIHEAITYLAQDYYSRQNSDTSDSDDKKA